MLLVLCVALVLGASTATEQSGAGSEMQEGALRRGERSVDVLLDGGLEKNLENQLVEVSEDDGDDGLSLERDDSEQEESSEEEDGMERRGGGGGRCKTKGTPCEQDHQGKCHRHGDRRRVGYAIKDGCPEKCPYCYLRCATNSTNLECVESGGTCRGLCIKKEFERKDFAAQPCFYEGCKCCMKCFNGSTECEKEGGVCRGDEMACEKRNRYESKAPCVDSLCVCCKPCTPTGKCAELNGYCTSSSICRDGFMEFPEDCTSSRCRCCAKEKRSNKKSG